MQKGDLATLSSYACEWLAAMLNTIEAGADWPDLCTQGRLAFLSKGGDAATPLDFRKLSILSKVYRLHMALRLKNLAPWISSWALPCLFAGTCDPAGAEDAWYETALMLELSKLEGTPFSGGGADIFKCFDQIIRVLMLDLLAAGGFPPRLARAYKIFYLKLFYRNTVAGGAWGDSLAPMWHPPGMSTQHDIHRLSPLPLGQGCFCCKVHPQGAC